MKIEKSVSPLGHTTLKFDDFTGTFCRLWVLKNTPNIRFDVNFAFAEFTQEDIKDLLPYLQLFTETGTIEPLQRDMSVTQIAAEIRQEQHIIKELENKLEKEKKEKAYYLRQLDKQIDQIADLEELIEKWRTISEVIHVDNELQ